MPVEYKDYYRILGVPKGASQDEIRKSFRKLAREYHPDVAKNKASAEEKFKEINEAYEVLGDPEKRKKYDELGMNWNRPEGFGPPPGWQEQAGRAGRGGARTEFHFGGTGFSDFFEQFFGSRARGGFPYTGFEGAEPNGPFEQAEGYAQRGPDVEGAILVTLGEVQRGSVRPISLEKIDPNTGQRSTMTFRVRIPAGVREGQVIRVAGKGEAGMGGGTPGDLFLRVKYAQHPDFEVRGADLYHDLDLAPWEAVLGAQVTMPTLDGSISLKIPPRSRQGQKLRLRGRGLPLATGETGDLYAVLTLQVPTEISPSEEELWEKLAATSQFKPRRKP